MVEVNVSNVGASRRPSKGRAPIRWPTMVRSRGWRLKRKRLLSGFDDVLTARVKASHILNPAHSDTPQRHSVNIGPLLPAPAPRSRLNNTMSVDDASSVLTVVLNWQSGLSSASRN